MVDKSTEDMIQKKDELQEKANDFKKKRDLLHEKSKKMAKSSEISTLTRLLSLKAQAF